jgi:NDMA-dependent alcohol dehydrogenase
MKTRAALLRNVSGPWQVEELELDEPGPGEVLVQMVASGYCHSDDHFTTGDMQMEHYPFVGGHEGGGIVRKVGPEVHGFAEGDHVLTTFIPSCGECRWCAMGMQNLCLTGAFIQDGRQMDGTFRLHDSSGESVGTMALLGTFSEWQVYDQKSVVKIEKDVDLKVGCLVSCGVQTGFGSASVAGGTKPGDVVVVVGVGGVGMNAVQGARASGASHILAIDPVEQKRKWALDFGATETYATIEECHLRVAHLTNGQGADVVILTAGLVPNSLLGAGFGVTGKAGTLVVTGYARADDDSPIPGLNAVALVGLQRRIQGAMYGMASPREAMPMLLNMYRAGNLKLDELITRTYSLDQINEAADDMREGRNIRGLIVY